MCTGRRQALIAPFCLVVLLACVDVYGQIADRTSVVINEISPASGGRSVAWIEFFNPQEVPVVLAGLMVGNGNGEEYVIADDFADLPARAYLVVWFDDAEPAGTVRTDRSGKIEVWAPADQAETWIPAHGILTLYEPREHAKPKVLDYVAWGEPGETWSVPLAEGFGVYDPATRLRPGDSIGLYPVMKGTPEHWVIYSDPEACEPENVLNPCEVTPGLPNPIPRPKTFTPANGSTLGANSVGFGWARRPLDEGFRLEMARDAQFDDVMFSLSVRSSSIRLGWSLEPGRYFVRNFAQSSGRWSEASPTYTFAVADSGCGNLPIMASQYPDAPMTPPAGWCTDIEPEKCKVLESIEFKYQRKDSRLFCPLCPAGARNKPHRSCATFVLKESEWPGGQPNYLPGLFCLWSSHRFSRSCRHDVAQWPNLSGQAEHGVQYCVPASVSMIVSAYGKCLSQDRIAFQIHSDPKFSTAAEDLGHKKLTYCGGTGTDCSATLKWALGLTPNPGEMYFQYVDVETSPIDFTGIKTWIDGHRPVMVASTQHASVIAGYCVESMTGEAQEEWLLVYDPIAGPLIVKASDVIATSIGYWATQPVENVVGTFDQAQLRASKYVRGDEGGIWSDWDGDGIVDFDEALRFSTSPFCSVTTPDGMSDLAVIQDESYPQPWAPWDPWLSCP